MQFYLNKIEDAYNYVKSISYFLKIAD